MRECLRVLECCARTGSTSPREEALVGGAAYDKHGEPLPADLDPGVKRSDSVLFGRSQPRSRQASARQASEKAILGLRKECDFFANLRRETSSPSWRTLPRSSPRS